MTDKAKIIEEIKEYIKTLFEGEASGHDYWHSVRVYNNACKIAQSEECDELVVALSALLHDADDSKIFDTSDFANARAIMHRLKVDADVENRVIEAIRTVSFKGSDSVIPETVEGKIVQDADRLDAIGAMGISRTFAFGGSRGRRMYDPSELPRLDLSEADYKTYEGTTVNHFYEKLFLLKDMMNTETAKEIAAHRHSFMKEFMQEFFLEWNGEK
ncbi:MAG: HD domain-containing protein [Ruminococcus sp.]